MLLFSHDRSQRGRRTDQHSDDRNASNDADDDDDWHEPWDPTPLWLNSRRRRASPFFAARRHARPPEAFADTSIMRPGGDEWVQQHHGRCFVPELLAEDVPVDQRAQAQRLVEIFPKEAEDILRARIDQAFQHACDALPKSMMVSRTELRATWLRAEYYNVAKAVQDE